VTVAERAAMRHFLTLSGFSQRPFAREIVEIASRGPTIWR